MKRFVFLFVLMSSCLTEVQARKIRVVWDAAGIPAPDLREMLALMNSSKVLSPLAKQTLDEDKVSGVEKFTFITGDQHGSTMMLEVRVEERMLGKGAQKYEDLVAETVGGMVRDQWQNALDRGFAQRTEAAHRAEREVQEHAAIYRELRERLRQSTGRTDVSIDGLRTAIASLEEERQKLSLQSAGQGARRKAIEAAIKRMGEQAQMQLKDDAVAKELQIMVEQAQMAHARMRQLHQQATVSESEVIRARAEVAQATARLLERQETVAARSGGDLLAELNRELTMLSISSAESEARAQIVDALLAQFSKVTKEIDQIEAALASRARAEQNLNAAISERDSFNRQRELLGRPQVIIQE